MMEMKFMLMIFLTFYLSSFFMFLANYKMFLVSLILSELLMLNSLFFVFFFLMGENMLSFMLYYFIMIVCESCLGLSIFVSMIRLNGKNLFNQFNFCMC